MMIMSAQEKFNKLRAIKDESGWGEMGQRGNGSFDLLPLKLRPSGIVNLQLFND